MEASTVGTLLAHIRAHHYSLRMKAQTEIYVRLDVAQYRQCDFLMAQKNKINGLIPRFHSIPIKGTAIMNSGSSNFPTSESVSDNAVGCERGKSNSWGIMVRTHHNSSLSNWKDMTAFPFHFKKKKKSHSQTHNKNKTLTHNGAEKMRRKSILSL